MSSHQGKRANVTSNGARPESVYSKRDQAEVVFYSFGEACLWSRENAGRAFTRCADGEGFRPVPESSAYRATQSWHDFEELYVDGPYRNEMD